MLVVLLPDEVIPPVILEMKELAPGRYHYVLVYTNEALGLVKTIVATHDASGDLDFGAVKINDGNAIWTLMLVKKVSREQLALHLAVPAARLDGRAIALVSEEHFTLLKDKIPGVEIVNQLICGSA